MAVEQAQINEVCRKLSLPLFTNTHIEFLKEYLIVFQPIADTLDKMQGESQVWMGDVIPLLLNLEFKLQKIEEKKLVHCTNLAKSLISNIKKRFAYIFDPNQDKNKYKFYLLATVSNPKWKNKWYINSEQRMEAKAVLLQEIKKY